MPSSHEKRPRPIRTVRRRHRPRKKVTRPTAPEDRVRPYKACTPGVAALAITACADSPMQPVAEIETEARTLIADSPRAAAAVEGAIVDIHSNRESEP